MAHQLQLQGLADELVRVTTSVPSTSAHFARCRESALRSLRRHSFLCTNHFDVAARLDGLEERLRVNHRESLADCLRSRRRLFSETALAHAPYAPEILHLLLEFADRPTAKTSLDDVLDLIGEHAADGTATGPSLRWEDVAREDGWNADDGNIWARPDFADGSGDDDGGTATGAATDEDEDRASSDASSTEAGTPRGWRRTVQDFVVPSEDAEPRLRRVLESQAWRTAAPATDPASGRPLKTAISELQILREALWMLQGVQTSLFDDECALEPAYRMEDVSWGVFRALAGNYIEVGRGLRVLRVFASRPRTAPHWQIFHDCIVRALARFDRRMSAVEARLVAPAAGTDVIVSMAATYEELRPHAEPLLALSGIVRQLCDPLHGGGGGGGGTSFGYLELLFDGVTMAQMTGRTAVYEFLARVFLDCFGVYVRSLRLWMEEGRLVPGDKVFFVCESASEVAPAMIWRSRFALRRTAEGALHAPAFLRPSAERIFTAGKNLVVLRYLGRFDAARAPWRHEAGDEPGLDFESVCCCPGRELIPFPELFGHAFDRWVESKHHATSSTLKAVVFDSFGLEAALDALECVYFLRDGAAADAFASALFARLDARDPEWNDDHALTSLAREAFARNLDPQRLTVGCGPDARRAAVARARDDVRAGLPSIAPRYRVPWPIQMMLAPECVPRYRAVFVFLLQLRRAVRALHGGRLLLAYDANRSNWAEHAIYYSVRARILWFCTTVQTYLATLVLAPNSAGLRRDIRAAPDVDAIIVLHAAFTKRVADEACLGTRLEPIRESILDVLDLAVRLRAAHARASAHEAGEMRELLRLSDMSSPLRRVTKKQMRPARVDYDGDGGDGDDGDGGDDGGEYGSNGDDSEDGGNIAGVHRRPRGHAKYKPFGEVLREVRADLERHLRFITGGLRGVARASSDPAASKWDLLADMLETGVQTGPVGT